MICTLLLLWCSAVYWRALACTGGVHCLLCIMVYSNNVWYCLRINMIVKPFCETTATYVFSPYTPYSLPLSLPPLPYYLQVNSLVLHLHTAGGPPLIVTIEDLKVKR